jgi:predicted methyltransferase
MAMIAVCALALTACGREAPPTPPEAPSAAAEATANGARLDAVLAAQSAETKARYPARRPKETLEFFGVAPGMTVVDTLPGDVWYAGILLDYLGPQGKVIGVDYAPQMWQQFGEYSPDPAESARWTTEFVANMQAKRGADAAAVAALQFDAIPDTAAGTVDVVLLSRSIHHLMRLEAQGAWLTKALADIGRLLKPGGIVGVEAHRAPESASDAWASGEQGYVKQSAVIAAFEKAGFELVGSSEMHANPKDQPTEKDFVWRLPPTLATSENDPALRAQLTAIGESDRMTLKFRKRA